jgi:uncharacterized protein (DUF302 family)
VSAILAAGLLAAGTAVAAEPGHAGAPAAARLKSVDAVVAEITRRIDKDNSLELVRTIDYTRRAGMFGFPMRPTKLMVFANPVLDAQLIRAEPLLALELPYRVLVHQKPNGSLELLFNPRAYLEKRFGYSGPLLDRYESQLAEVISGLRGVAVKAVPPGDVKLRGGLNIAKSRYSVDETVANLLKAVIADGAYHWFVEVDHQRDAAAQGIGLGPMKLVFFGRPKLGARVMKTDVSLGLEYLAERVLIWQTESGVQVAYDDLYWQAIRRGRTIKHTIERARTHTGTEIRRATR